MTELVINNSRASSKSLSAKQWLCALPIIVIAFLLIALFMINVLIDPYGEYQLISHPLNKNKFYADSKTSPVSYAQRLKKKPYALVFGTSRSNHISDKHLGQDVLNFSTSVSGRPTHVNYFLKHLSQEQLSNIREIFYLIDVICFVPSEFHSNPSKKDFSYYLGTIKSVNRYKFGRAISTLLRNTVVKCGYYISEDGVVVSEKFDQYHPDQEEIDRDRNSYLISCHEEALQNLSEVQEFCTKNNIRITYFTDIFNVHCMQCWNFESLAQFMTKITKRIPHLYSLMYMEGFSSQMEYFEDLNHHKDELTVLQCDILKSAKKLEQYKISSDNVQDYLNTLKQALE